MTAALTLEGRYVGNVNYGAKAFEVVNLKRLEGLCRLSEDDLLTFEGRIMTYSSFKSILEYCEIKSIHLSEKAHQRHCNNPLPMD